MAGIQYCCGLLHVFLIFVLISCSWASSEGDKEDLQRKYRMSLASNNDSELYAKNLQSQFHGVVEKNQQLEARFEAQKDKLAESSRDNATLTSKFVEFQVVRLAG